MESKNKLSTRKLVLTSLAAGAVAGALAKTTIAPLDRTKIYFQTTPTAPFSLRQVLLYLRLSYSSDGLLALYRGNSATMARIIPYSAIQFTAHEQFKEILKPLSLKKPNVSRFMAGSLAGITAQSLTYPLDMTRARLAVSPKSKYSSLVDVFKKVIRNEGIRTLYRGYVPTILGVIPYAGFSFYTYETLKKSYFELYKEEARIEKLFFGAVSGVVGQSSSYPLDIVRRRMQVGVFKHGSWNVYKLLYDIARNEGLIRGLYKGLSMNWIKGPIAAGISFSAFDFFSSFLREHL